MRLSVLKCVVSIATLITWRLHYLGQCHERVLRCIVDWRVLALQMQLLAPKPFFCRLTSKVIGKWVRTIICEINCNVAYIPRVLGGMEVFVLLMQISFCNRECPWHQDMSEDSRCDWKAGKYKVLLLFTSDCKFYSSITKLTLTFKH